MRIKLLAACLSFRFRLLKAFCIGGTIILNSCTDNKSNGAQEFFLKGNAYAQGHNTKSICIITSEGKSVSFVLPEQQHQGFVILQKKNGWGLTSAYGRNSIVFSKIDTDRSAIDKNMDVFRLYDQEGKLAAKISYNLNSNPKVNWIYP